MGQNNRITLPVTEFAVPVPRVGSIEWLSGYARATEEGQEIHLRLQELRAKENPNYQAEVKISHSIEHSSYFFQINGKIDGLIPGKKTKIEEIKSGFYIKELSKKLTRDPYHPYCLQLRTYGYFYFLQSGLEPELQFCLVSSRTGMEETLTIELDLENYKLWWERRLLELVQEVKANEKRTDRRIQVASRLEFPFDNPRPGQTDLIEKIEDSINEKNRILIQAPTGLGKTVGVLQPVLKETLSRGQRVIYVTPKNTQHAVAEDAVERFQEKGAKVKSLTITAKNKICFKNEPLCNPEYCEFAKDHYTKIHQNGLKEILSSKKKLTSRVIKLLADRYQVCPFELQWEAAQEADVVICDYNYVFSPRSSLGQVSSSSIGQEHKPSLVIDEAHNLFSRALGYYSPELSTFTLEKIRTSLQDLPERFRKTATLLLDQCRQTILSLRPEGTTSEIVEIIPPVGVFLDQEEELRTFLSRYLESDVEIQPRDPVLKLCYYWSEFTASLDFVCEGNRPEFFTVFRPNGENHGTVRIVCCDASAMLKACHDNYDQVVGFSATLKPFEYYAKLSGLDPKQIHTAEFESPFPKEQRKLLIIPEISTKYSERSRNYPKIAEAIHKIAAVKPGNYFAFFPSFDFLEKVLEHFQLPKAFQLRRQEKDMKADAAGALVEELREKKTPTLVFAVQGGIFSEGVDYPGETVIGAFVVGPPLPPFDFEREKIRQYYETNYGTGFDYTYTYPAMARAVQAAGRVIRSETDKGLIVLMDNRFLSSQYASSMPKDWFQETPRELVSKQILKEVSDFWSNF